MKTPRRTGQVPGLGFRTKLLLLVILPVIPALAFLLHRNLELRKTEKARVTDGIVSLSRLIAASESSFIKNTRQQLATVSEFPFLVLTTNQAFAHIHLANLLKLSPDYLIFGLLETNGTLFASSVSMSNVPPDLNFLDRSYFRRTLERGQFSIGDFQVGRLTRERSLNFGYPVFDENRQVKRVFFASLKLTLLSETAAKIPLPPDAAVTVLDRNGTVLARVPDGDRWVGQRSRELPGTNAMIEARNGIVEVPGLDGLKRVYAVTAISDGQAPAIFVTVGIPSDVLFAAADRAITRSLVLVIFVITVALLGSSLLAQWGLLRPLRTLSSAALQLAEGDWKTRAPESLPAKELNELAGAFNAMAASLEKRETELKQAQSAIQALNVELEAKVRQRTAELEGVNRELEAFSYSVSHDLRAPLRHMDGFVQLLHKHAGPALDAKSQRYVKMIAEAAQEMAALIDSLLSFSRMGRAELHAASVNLGELVRETIKDLEPDVGSRHVDWKVGPLAEVKADPQLLRQVVVNLLSNALKYSRTRERAEIEVGEVPSQNGEQVFFVSDNGVGFDMRYANKLFGVFQRLHDHDQFEGTGIGLANVHRIITRHGGRTWAESAVGQGARFFFSLPKSTKDR